MGNAAGFLGAERVWASQGETSPSNTFPHVLAVTHNLQEPPPRHAILLATRWERGGRLFLSAPEDGALGSTNAQVWVLTLYMHLIRSY